MCCAYAVKRTSTNFSACQMLHREKCLAIFANLRSLYVFSKPSECSANILIEASHENLLLYQGFDFNCDPANVVYLSGLPVTFKKAQVSGLQML